MEIMRKQKSKWTSRDIDFVYQGSTLHTALSTSIDIFAAHSSPDYAQAMIDEDTSTKCTITYVSKTVVDSQLNHSGSPRLHRRMIQLGLSTPIDRPRSNRPRQMSNRRVRVFGQIGHQYPFIGRRILCTSCTFRQWIAADNQRTQLRDRVVAARGNNRENQ